jgi:hypothetical protein
MAFTLKQLVPNNIYQLKTGRQVVFKELNRRGFPVFFPPGQPGFEDCFALMKWQEVLSRDLGPAHPNDLVRPTYHEDGDTLAGRLRTYQTPQNDWARPQGQITPTIDWRTQIPVEPILQGTWVDDPNETIQQNLVATEAQNPINVAEEEFDEPYITDDE